MFPLIHQNIRYLDEKSFSTEIYVFLVWIDQYLYKYMYRLLYGSTFRSCSEMTFVTYLQSTQNKTKQRILFLVFWGYKFNLKKHTNKQFLCSIPSIFFKHRKFSHPPTPTSNVPCIKNDSTSWNYYNVLLFLWKWDLCCTWVFFWGVVIYDMYLCIYIALYFCIC